MTWREAFAMLQLEAEEKIGTVQRAAYEALIGRQQAASAGLRGLVEE